VSSPAVLAGQPQDADGPVFREPWEAQAFATTLMLHQRGLYTWSEWAEALAGQIAAAAARGEQDLGDRYYHHWLAALESIIARKGASSGAELRRYRRAWQSAAERTRHGLPIELQAEDFRG
jgi:nitrile hydratase accessory protein